MRSSRCVLQAWLAFSLASAPTFVRAQEAEPQAQDPMSAYRERFRMGLVRYQAGNVSEAIQFWEPVYRELGAARGWRLAFNLARAYELFGDATRAVERYESFLSQVAERRQRGEVIEELIQKEEDVARAKLAEMASTKGRIVVPAEGERAIAVMIDGSEARLAGFTAYVAPGQHTVVLEPGSPRESRQVLEVAAGQAAVVRLPAKAPPPTLSASPAALWPVEERPFPKGVLFVAGGATALSVLAPVLTFSSAKDFQEQNRLSSEPGASEANLRKQADYDAKKTTYAATLAIPITLAVATGALAAWYFFGGRTRLEARPSLAGAGQGGTTTSGIGRAF